MVKNYRTCGPTLFRIAIRKACSLDTDLVLGDCGEQEGCTARYGEALAGVQLKYSVWFDSGHLINRSRFGFEC